jgi:hypothetical protein
MDIHKPLAHSKLVALMSSIPLKLPVYINYFHASPMLHDLKTTPIHNGKLYRVSYSVAKRSAIITSFGI